MAYKVLGEQVMDQKPNVCEIHYIMSKSYFLVPNVCLV